MRRPWAKNSRCVWSIKSRRREVVLQMFKYDGYAKDKDGNFTQSKFVEVSNKVAYAI